MKEHQPIPNKPNLAREIPGKIIFDKDGNPIGIDICDDGSLDFASPADKKNTVIVIRPLKEGK